MPPRIFINYRREDASGHAGRLYDALAGRFGREQVFMDVDAIRPGENFATVLDDSVASCDFLIALIGRRWLSAADRDGRPRLDRPEDYVRLELQTALTSPHTRVIPTLVQGAEMPASDELPAPMRQLAQRQAVELSDLRWRSDVDRLMRNLDSDAAEDEAVLPRTGRARGRLVGAVVAAVAGVAALGAVLALGAPWSPRHAASVATRPATQPRRTPAVRPPAPPAPGVRYASVATNGFQALLPHGPGWSAPATSEPTPGRLFRTSVRRADGAFVFVDYTPRDKPIFGGSYLSRRRVGQTAFGSAVRYVLDDGAFPGCRRSRCVDDQISVPGSAGGLAVLAGGPSFATTRRLASTVTASLTPAGAP